MRARGRNSANQLGTQLRRALKAASHGSKPVAFIIAGHNGSGKSTLWHQRLGNRLRLPLINADRLTLSILPELDRSRRLPPWAQELRDSNENWQRLSQDAVKLFISLIASRKMPFAFESVFSHIRKRIDGTFESKADSIRMLQDAGYFVVLIFVGLASVELSIARVATRLQQGGHAVPLEKLRSRFPRTQRAIGMSAHLADRTLMFDNSGDLRHAFSLVRVQKRHKILFDCRRDQPASALTSITRLWMDKVVPIPQRSRAK